MHYGSLLAQAADAHIRVAIIGFGDYGRSLFFQALRAPGLDVVAVCDRDPDRVRAGLISAGMRADRIVPCNTPSQAGAAIAHGNVVVADDGEMVSRLPLDVVVEATGHPESAALHADLALREGRHVVMVSKEADSVLGPLFSARARAANLVYTPVDGDQPSLLIQLVLWARTCGLTVLSAAKSSEYDFVFDPGAETVRCLERVVQAPGFADLWHLGTGPRREVIDARARALKAIPQRTVADLTEMGIVANALGLGVDRPDFHAPVARTQEIPDLLVPGGLLAAPGCVDVVNLLRRPDEFSLAGGVFVTVACEDRHTWEVLREKGHLVSHDGSAATILNPVHLLGIQSATTILLAALEGRSSGAETLTPHVDLVARARAPLAAGTRLEAAGHHHEIPGLDGELQPARAVTASAPVPFYMLSGHRLRVDVAPGALVTRDMIEAPSDSLLWRLRTEMDAAFF
ncbi:MAG: flagellar biosynthesis protein FlgA [Tropicimonas sp.]|uniref:flagellar biosynthesis protein FlgA n=1 Tax=Tropicimonas sp. TaxID=2067044 RepID=UPI003A851B50